MKQKDKRIEKHLTDSVRLSLSEPAVCIGRTGRNISRYSRGTLFIVLVLTCLASNCRDNNPPPPAKVALMPMCTIELETGNNGPPSWGYNGQIFVADRDNATVQGNFSPFRLASRPLGDPTIDRKRSLVIRSTDLPDVFSFNEATLRRRGDYEVHRAQLIPIWINNYGYNEDDGVAWKIQVEDAFGKWTTQGAGVPSFGWDTMQKTLASQSPTKAPLGQEVWAGPKPENLGATPQLMSVGEAGRHEFAWAGS